MANLLTYSRTQEFLTSLVPPREPEMKKMEKYAEKTDFPIIAPLRLLLLPDRTHDPCKIVFEMGSGYGYSTAWFAKAVRKMAGEWCITWSGTQRFPKWHAVICPGLASMG